MFRTAFKGQKIPTKNASGNELPRKKTSLGKEKEKFIPQEREKAKSLNKGSLITKIKTLKSIRK